MFPFGKLVDGGVVINTVPTKFSSSPLLFLNNRLNYAKFLVDTGASVAVFPHLPHLHSAPDSGVQLRTADCSPMNTNGSCCLALQFGSRRFEWSLACNISMPILGLDFLGHDHLLVDAAGSYLLDSSILESIPALSSNSSNSSSDLYTALLSTSEEFCDFLSKYPDVVSSKGFSTLPHLPVFAKACRPHAEKL